MQIGRKFESVESLSRIWTKTAQFESPSQYFTSPQSPSEKRRRFEPWIRFTVKYPLDNVSASLLTPPANGFSLHNEVSDGVTFFVGDFRRQFSSQTYFEVSALIE